jgi:hypothetical protein
MVLDRFSCSPYCALRNRQMEAALMNKNGKQLEVFLLTADKLVRGRWDGCSENMTILNSALEGETVRGVAQDPANLRRFYAATMTEIHVSEDAGASWKWVPAGGIDYRDIWAMAVQRVSNRASGAV